MLILLLAIGSGVLSLVAPDSVGELLFFVFGILAVAIILKVLVDIVLFYKKVDEDEASDQLLSDSDGRTFFDLETYMQARKKRQRARKIQNGS